MADNKFPMIVLLCAFGCAVCLLNGKNLLFMIILSRNVILPAGQEMPNPLVRISK